MFIEPDEHLIVLDMNNVAPLSDYDLDMLEQAGVRTIHVIEGVRRSTAVLPRYADRFKVLLPFYWSGESVVELFQRRSKVKMWAETCAALSNPNVQFIYALPDGGEFLWDAAQTDNFPLSDEQIAEFVIDIQRVFVQQHGEIWLTLNNALGHHENWNNLHLPYLYKALRDEFPNTPFYSAQYAYLTVGGTPTPQWMRDKVGEYTDEFGIRFFVGPDYCEGLERNFHIVEEQNAWGFVVGPIHTENPVKHNQIEPWMVEALRDTDKKFKELYDDNAFQP